MKKNATIENPGRRQAIASASAGLAGLFTVLGSDAADAAYPTRAISLVAPFAPGGPNDIVARSVAEPLRDSLKQPVTVDNVSGAGGIVGTRKVLAAPADGYLLLVGAAYLVTAPHLYKTSNFDAARDFIPLSPPVESLLVFVSAEHADLKKLLDRARQTGNPVRYASPGAGTLSHLGAEMLRLASGAPMMHVPYRGVAPALSDVMGGHADILVDGLSSSLPLIRDGRLKALAIPDSERNPLLPDVPTTGQLGFPDVKVRAWNAIFARAGTPVSITDLLTAEITRILGRPEVSGELKKRGLETTAITPAAFRQRMAAESAQWKSVVSAGRITVE